VSELEILRRRRELVLLSAKLQRATIVRRLDNVGDHPVQAVIGLAGSVVSVPLLFKVGTMLFSLLASRRSTRLAVKRGRATLFSKVVPYLRFLPMLKMFPVLKFLNR
jgi:hypothetical protein